MQIHHEGKTYTMDDELASSVIKQLKGLGFLVELITKPEQNLEEAFAEDFPNTWGKPEEKPTWFVETSEMKKSEYCEVFKEWFIKASGGNENSWSWTCERYGFGGSRYMNGYEGDSFEWDERKDFTKLSPQQWYEEIYDGNRRDYIHGVGFVAPAGKYNPPDHDKAMEIPEVHFLDLGEDTPVAILKNRINTLADCFNLLIKAHNNK